MLDSAAPWVLVLGLVVLGFILAWVVLRLSIRESTAAVTATLGVLTLAAIGAFVITRSEILGTIAATGIGALASAVTSIWDAGRRRGKDDDEK